MKILFHALDRSNSHEIAEGEAGPERQRVEGRKRNKEKLRLRYLLDTSSLG